MKNIYTVDVKGITTSSASFELFIRSDMLYVDKTSYICKLIKNPARNFYFISRPRRFGKSLFCNTLESLFKGDKELFKGLYIYDKYDYAPYPVLHFDFSGIPMLTLDGFLSSFRNQIRIAVKQFGIAVSDTDDPATAFENAINEIHEKYGEMVIIIDEYDDPLITVTLRNKPFLDDIREAFNSFYKTIKKNAGKVRFFFMTGVVKLSNLSIFSAMNNLVDLSMDKEFAGAFGYTDEELDEYFGEGIDEYLEANPGVYESREEFREKIKSYYDGYRFSPESETRVYNPVSIGFFFNDDCRFDEYWKDTGSTSFAINLARKHNLGNVVTDEQAISKYAFSTFDIADLNKKNVSEDALLALLYFSGYLSIKEPLRNGISLSFPNREVSAAFSYGLVQWYIGSDSAAMTLSNMVADAVEEGNTDKLMMAIESYFSSIPYSAYDNTHERTFQGFLMNLFLAASMIVHSEDSTSDGRIDITLEGPSDFWIFELKVDRSADEALSQIDAKKYAEKYGYLKVTDRIHHIHKIGINFSSGKRNIEEWVSKDS